MRVAYCRFFFLLIFYSFRCCVWQRSWPGRRALFLESSVGSVGPGGGDLGATESGSGEFIHPLSMMSLCFVLGETHPAARSFWSGFRGLRLGGGVSIWRCGECGC